MSSRPALKSTWYLLAFFLAPAVILATESAPDRLSIEPPGTILDGRRASAQLIATGHYTDGAVRDLTHEGNWTSSDPAIVAVHPGGRIEPRGDGQAEVRVDIGSSEATTVIRVRNAGKAHPIRFEHEVLPVLTKVGCNQGACHGTPTGKNGFRLSLRGFNPALDFEILARERQPAHQPVRARGELDPPQGHRPDPPRGGRRMGIDSVGYRVLRDWVAEGVRPDPAGHAGAGRAGRDAPGADAGRSARAAARRPARFADGSIRDVTRLARYGSTDDRHRGRRRRGPCRQEEAGRDDHPGLLRALVVAVPLLFREPVPGLTWVDPAENNFIDGHVFAKLKLLRIPPSELSDDAPVLSPRPSRRDRPCPHARGGRRIPRGSPPRQACRG